MPAQYYSGYGHACSGAYSPFANPAASAATPTTQNGMQFHGSQQPLLSPQQQQYWHMQQQQQQPQRDDYARRLESIVAEQQRSLDIANERLAALETHAIRARQDMPTPRQPASSAHANACRTIGGYSQQHDSEDGSESHSGESNAGGSNAGGGAGASTSKSIYSLPTATTTMLKNAGGSLDTAKIKGFLKLFSQRAGSHDRRVKELLGLSATALAIALDGHDGDGFDHLREADTWLANAFVDSLDHTSTHVLNLVKEASEEQLSSGRAMMQAARALTIFTIGAERLEAEAEFATLAPLSIGMKPEEVKKAALDLIERQQRLPSFNPHDLLAVRLMLIDKVPGTKAKEALALKKELLQADIVAADNAERVAKPWNTEQLIKIIALELKGAPKAAAGEKPPEGDQQQCLTCGEYGHTSRACTKRCKTKKTVKNCPCIHGDACVFKSAKKLSSVRNAKKARVADSVFKYLLLEHKKVYPETYCADCDDDDDEPPPPTPPAAAPKKKKKASAAAADADADAEAESAALASASSATSARQQLTRQSRLSFSADSGELPGNVELALNAHMQRWDAEEHNIEELDAADLAALEERRSPPLAAAARHRAQQRRTERRRVATLLMQREAPDLLVQQPEAAHPAQQPAAPPGQPPRRRRRDRARMGADRRSPPEASTLPEARPLSPQNLTTPAVGESTAVRTGATQPLAVVHEGDMQLPADKRMRPILAPPLDAPPLEPLAAAQASEFGSDNELGEIAAGYAAADEQRRREKDARKQARKEKKSVRRAAGQAAAADAHRQLQNSCTASTAAASARRAAQEAHDAEQARLDALAAAATAPTEVRDALLAADAAPLPVATLVVDGDQTSGSGDSTSSQRRMQAIVAGLDEEEHFPRLPPQA